MDAGVGPMLFPVIEILLRRLETLEAKPLQRRPFRVSYTALDFSFPIRMADPAREGHGTVMPEHVAVKRIECGVVYVRGENAFAQIVEDNHASDATKPAKSFLVQLGPCLRTGPEHQQANRLAAITQSQHKQSCAPILAALRIANHLAVAIID